MSEQLPSNPLWLRAAAEDSLAPGQCRSVAAGGRQFCLVRLDAGFHALDDECPHKGAPLGAGHLENGKVYCPMHGWCFHATSGACESNPAKPARHYATKIEGGEVWIGVNDKA